MESYLNIQRLAASYWLGVISEVIGKMARTFIPSGREVQKAEVKFRVLAEDGFQRKARIEVEGASRAANSPKADQARTSLGVSSSPDGEP